MGSGTGAAVVATARPAQVRLICNVSRSGGRAVVVAGARFATRKPSWTVALCRVSTAGAAVLSAARRVAVQWSLPAQACSGVDATRDPWSDESCGPLASTPASCRSPVIPAAGIGAATGVVISVDVDVVLDTDIAMACGCCIGRPCIANNATSTVHAPTASAHALRARRRVLMTVTDATVRTV